MLTLQGQENSPLPPQKPSKTIYKIAQQFVTPNPPSLWML